ncbi:adenosylcobinamide amidohydrolase [Roseinatronobacter sp.]|uniref:adenosylcobinamide amidohydrolase n=1 Tax=Roseinatronobacter sp. TaxID=1945755 RepID=UPI0025D59C2D|nr:adenosylcobinamide amidohydrolase [Roseibaca sp.]
MMQVKLAAPWLECDLGAPHRVLSWAPHRPGYQTARHILWRQVRNADLPADLDVGAWLALEMAGRDAVCLLTSRDIAFHQIARATVEGVTAQALATVGLSNAEAVGARADRTGRDWDKLLPSYGTINIAVQLSLPLSDTGLLEALSIATQARTAAIVAAGHRVPGGAIATGTGTDCIAVAAPLGAEHYAGLHTAQGEAIGRAVFDAVAQGAADWQATIGPQSEG